MLTPRQCSMRQRAMSPMRAGEVVRCDFGSPARGEPGFVRPGIVVTSDDVLKFRQHAIVVVPCTTTKRGWLTAADGRYLRVVGEVLGGASSVRYCADCRNRAKCSCISSSG
ncbi:MAG: type II toxin-antitoxin system PemK/MazF family toxin [Acidimicrobiaceae bacterium]|nr:type II toxin-antitoxin system PemK/MazF family toxin [Acidimicrobiaceae bacterium]MYK67950.1 type II toxin-antitoxin system PemK/MazF family toxin [Gemmatimonadota bacterium]